MKRGIYADHMDKKAVTTLCIQDDGSVLLGDDVEYESMNKWLRPFRNDSNRLFFRSPKTVGLAVKVGTILGAF